MRAVVLHGVDDLRVEEVPDPSVVPGTAKVRVEYGGICGSDLHYWKHGGAGTSKVREPMVLGHEIAGRVVDVASDVESVSVGDRVTVHPATFPVPCSLYTPSTVHLSPEVEHLGSAAKLPHAHGAFSDFVVVPADQLRPLPDNLPTRVAVVSEPLGVALHAIARVGDVDGRVVMVNGVGPIGCLVVAGVVAAGARKVWVSDITDTALGIATRLGAHHAVNVARGDSLPENADVVFEATGVPRALAQCFASVRPGGTIVQVGMLPRGEIGVEMAQLVTKEVDYLGSFRFLDEIADAVSVLAAGATIEPMLTHTFDVADALRAFEQALDRSVAGKVLLRF